MLCGASDVDDVLPSFNNVSKDMGFQALNFINGDILYHNYGQNKWERNSKMTVHNANVLVFVINSKFGGITWATEFEEAISNGKNFIVLCHFKTYQQYRLLVDNHMPFPKDSENPNLSKICGIIQKLEMEFEVTIINFNYEDFEITLKKELLKLFKFGVELTEKDNRKNSFLPILMSSKFNDFPKNLINETNNKLCKEILFDFFENKEIRKRAMDYFIVSKDLTTTEIIELCLDNEQGISRKAVSLIGGLINETHDKDLIFAEILTSIANEEIGVVRRAINSFIELDLSLSIRYFNLFFPTTDVGVPKRIISKFFEKRQELKSILLENNEEKEMFFKLIELCLNYNSDKTPWKEQAKQLLDVDKEEE